MVRHFIVLMVICQVFIPDTFAAYGDYVQNGADTCATTGTSVTCAYDSNVTAGNTLFAVVKANSTTAALTMDDSLTQTWSQVDCQAVGVTYQSCLFRFSNTAGGANTVTFRSDTSTGLRFVIAEFEGNSTGDGTPVSATGTGTTAASGNFNVSGSAPLLIGGFTSASNTTHTTADNYTIRAASGADPSTTVSLGSRQPGASGTYNASTTLGTSLAWGAIGAGFSAAAAPPASSIGCKQFLLLGVGGKC